VALTPASNGPASVISLRLTAYARRALNTVEVAQYRVSHTERCACLRLPPQPRSHQRVCPPARTACTRQAVALTLLVCTCALLPCPLLFAAAARQLHCGRLL
jgi:hypothetical protein